MKQTDGPLLGFRSSPETLLHGVVVAMPNITHAQESRHPVPTGAGKRHWCIDCLGRNDANGVRYRHAPGIADQRLGGVVAHRPTYNTL